MSLRELRVLVHQLPPESAFQRALRGHHWEDRDFMLADVSDATRFLYAAMTESKKRPHNTPRPGQDQLAARAEKENQLREQHDQIIAKVLPMKRKGA